jgi:hypothetical protein
VNPAGRRVVNGVSLFQFSFDDTLLIDELYYDIQQLANNLEFTLLQSVSGEIGRLGEQGSDTTGPLAQPTLFIATVRFCFVEPPSPSSSERPVENLEDHGFRQNERTRTKRGSDTCYVASSFLRQPPRIVEHPRPRRPLLRPRQRLRSRVDLVVVAAGREGQELDEGVGELRGLRAAARQSRFRGLSVQAHDLVALGGKTGRACHLNSD